MVVNIYEKSIPCMGNKIIRYNMTEKVCSGQTYYGIQISQKQGNIYREDTVEDISADKNLVYNIITYLYENAIDTSHFKDIVEDYLFKLSCL